MITHIKFPLKANQLESLIKSQFTNNSADDLVFSIYTHQNKKIAVFGITYMLDMTMLGESLLAPLLSHQEAWTTETVLNEIPLSNGTTTNRMQDILDQLPLGNVFLYIEDEAEIVTYPINTEQQRSLEISETESVIVGPHLAFTDSLRTNLNLVRQLIPTSDLVIEKFMVGNKTPREVRMLYMKSVANDTDVDTLRQRIEELDVDEIEDNTVLKQFLEDSARSLFPQFYLTELVNRLVYTLKQGKIGVMAENSPSAFIAPSSFFSFFETSEDTYTRWLEASAIRVLRMFAMLIALFVTPFYVALVTYQYQIIPTDLIVSIGQSRASVPFPPVIEALLIELMIELLREAGARLPTKIGQTMGIVGGIVIGQAAVDAGITSNVLIIVVAMSALASFTTPSYTMGTSFRIIRFPMIVLAGLYGIIGVMFGTCLLLIHVLKMKSLGRPYLAPLYPIRLQDFNRVFFRTPPDKNSKRASLYRPKDREQFSKEDASQKRDIEQ